MFGINLAKTLPSSVFFNGKWKGGLICGKETLAHKNRGKINFVSKDNVHGQGMKIKDSS